MIRHILHNLAAGISDPDDLSGGRPEMDRRSSGLSNIRNANRFFNLTSSDRVDLSFLSDPDSDESAGYIDLIVRLVKKGVVGFEVLDVRHQPYKSFITTSIGDQRLYGARPYRKPLMSVLA